ncbi:MAG TPA: ribosome small subunit-dependent GTPase A [Tepidisphaeraceae bacterium]|nr:ribosome small subunit-dependent GTPase A [Tepidisphaeraceae bacterium]
MKGKPKKGPREKDLTSRYMSGGMDEDRVEKQERFTDRSKHAQHNKMMKTTAMRDAADGAAADAAALPVGEVVQIFSLYSEVQHGDTTYLCVVRKTLSRTSKTSIVVGDRVRFRAGGTKNEAGQPEAVIEHIEPRATILTRADSFRATTQHPIVANAQQMLIVASLLQPRVKWGLVNRMIVAALSGKLRPIVCLNKVDLAEADKRGAEALAEAEEALAHYVTLDVRTLRTSAEADIGLNDLRAALRGQSTVLAGHSGVGKSSLIRSIQPQLDLRVAEVSAYTDKGRHTTTSARRYVLDLEGGGSVIDTPGVKLFGLWGVTRENLDAFFPDVANGVAPAWRRESYDRIAASLRE